VLSFLSRSKRRMSGMEVSPANTRTISCFDALSDELLAAWDPEGDRGRQLMLNPTIFRLLGDLAGKAVLDAGCGQGYLSRLMATRGAAVVGVESAARLVAYAEARESERKQGITYFRRDLSRLGDVGGPFDTVVANMVLLDIPDWQPALSNCISALKPGGLLVYSLEHPCWAPNAMAGWAERRTAELREYLGTYEVPGGVGGAISFHRPLSDYLQETIRLGCDIVEVAEPGLTPDQVEDPDEEILVHIPNFIVIAARRTSAEPQQ
jgi:SAM-dependent methyltransferase